MSGHGVRSKKLTRQNSQRAVPARTSQASCGVCAAVTFARLHIIPAVNAFLVIHPGLNLKVVLDDRNVDLVEEGIDVALRMDELSDSSMAARRLGESRRVVVGTPAYFARAGIPQAPADLSGHQAIVYNQGGGGIAWTFRRGSSESSVAVSGRMSINVFPTGRMVSTKTRAFVAFVEETLGLSMAASSEEPEATVS